VAVSPLLVLAIALAGTVFDEADARQRVIGEIEKLAGPQASAAVATVQSPATSTSGALATLLGLGTLVFGALGVFTNLQQSLNTSGACRHGPQRVGGTFCGNVFSLWPPSWPPVSFFSCR